MKIVYTKEYEMIGKFSCKELAKILTEAGGDVRCCPFGASYFVEDLDDEVHMIDHSWAWINAQHGNKKLYLLDYPKETRDIQTS